MATIADTPPRTAAGEHRFFLIASWLLAAMTVGGFALNAATGRSSFDVPLVYHLHAFVFMGFIALYALQATLAAKGNTALHMRLGQVAVVYIPLMLIMGVWLTFATLQFLGGPPFFAQSEFLVVNLFHLAAFAALAVAALRLRKRPDWHKRLMFGAMVTVSIPGIARLLPLPFLIPWAFPIIFGVASLFILAGMMMDRRVRGSVHAAWWWALIGPIAAMGMGEVIGATGYAKTWVAGHVAGTPGGERSPDPFLPPGF
ncbi:MAG: hypothetical protein JJ901_00175 [Erythrobacter sp.]|uniref:hypothetical protein n=1 Tax=Erythrobacter sp. TaxID=1042 RepID=UPI001B11E293|nr:hypothetical protein [Erythrobacter sp.]MBO6766701.1 hypothetical protein [Erythrobacter sp.]